MTRLFWFWNLLYYFLFKWTIQLHRFFDRINPLSSFTKTTNFKKYTGKKGVEDFSGLMEEIMNNKVHGLNLHLANFGLMGISVMLITIVLYIIQIILFKFPFITNDFTLIVVTLASAIFLNNKIVFNNDKYLAYFHEFEKIDLKKKRRYNWLFLLFVVIVVFLFFFSLFASLIAIAIGMRN